MNRLYAEKLIELGNVANVIQGISYAAHIPTNEFSIMGGHARRLYMLHHDIAMTDQDIESWRTSDIDIFCDIANVLGSDMIRFIERMTVDENDIPNYSDIPEEVFEAINLFAVDVDYDTDAVCKNAISEYLNGNDTNLTTLIDCIVKKRIVHFLDEIKELFKNVEDTKLNHVSYHTKFGTVMVAEDVQIDVGQLLQGFDVDNILRMTECTISDISYVDPSFKVSAKHLSFAVPIGHKIQLIFGNNSKQNTIDDFDIPQSKFSLGYPYEMCDVEYLGNGGISFDDFYYIDEIKMCDISPFRLMDRLSKYSRYGFTFAPNVLDRLHKHIDEFIDNNPIQASVTYTSSLYE